MDEIGRPCRGREKKQLIEGQGQPLEKDKKSWMGSVEFGGFKENGKVLSPPRGAPPKSSLSKGTWGWEKESHH